jgi:hypothetical protein
MHPASTASLRVASSSFAVMKMTGHFDPGCRKSALQLDPRNSSEVDVEHQAGCRLRAAALEQRLRGGERPAFDAVVPNSRATPFRKPALSSTTITTVGCAAISVSQAPVRYVPKVVATLDLDQRNLVRCEQSGCVERPPN